MNIENRKRCQISVIIPCYNAENYLVKCLNSLQQQSIKNWEAICINDGSEDYTLNILQEYSLSDMRVKVYTQQNQGAAKARELGIEKATGDYITFLDIDDTLPPEALQTMVNAFAPNIDIVVSGFRILKGSKNIKTKTLQSALFDSLNYLKKVLCGQYGWELWAKMYRRDLFIKPIKVPTIHIGEDAAVFIQLVCRARKIKILSSTLYNYIQYSQSISHVKSLKYVEETIQAAFFIEDILKDKDFYTKIKYEIDAMFLLFYSNSTRRGYLDKNHPLVKEIRSKHFNLCALMKIPFYKALYICFFYMMGKKISTNKYIRKFYIHGF